MRGETPLRGEHWPRVGSCGPETQASLGPKGKWELPPVISVFSGSTWGVVGAVLFLFLFFSFYSSMQPAVFPGLPLRRRPCPSEQNRTPAGGTVAAGHILSGRLRGPSPFPASGSLPGVSAAWTPHSHVGRAWRVNRSALAREGTGLSIRAKVPEVQKQTEARHVRGWGERAAAPKPCAHWSLLGLHPVGDGDAWEHVLCPFGLSWAPFQPALWMPAGSREGRL